MGPDNKHSPKIFAKKKNILQLTKIINRGFKLCYFPNISRIISIPKPGKNLQLPESYRPIALLSSLSKIYERSILFHLQNSVSGKIREEQFAFRRNHSTTLQLTKLIDQLSANLNQGIQTAAVFLDVEKAFDCVWHDGLLHKMMKMDIPLQLIKIIESFLSDRTFSVKIESQNSSLRIGRAGVPQGSCLSPTLFNIYTNDMPTELKSQCEIRNTPTPTPNKHSLRVVQKVAPPNKRGKNQCNPLRSYTKIEHQNRSKQHQNLLVK